jgi:subtilisin family serine protease
MNGRNPRAKGGRAASPDGTQRGSSSKQRSSVLEYLEARTLLSAAPPVAGKHPHQVTPAWFQVLEPAAAWDGATTLLDWNGAVVKAVPDEWIVQLSESGLKAASSVAAAGALLAESPFSLQVVRGLGLAGSLLVSTPGAAPAAVGSWLGGLASVGYFEPNLIRSVQVIPNDSNFSQLWGMHNTGQSGGTVDADIDAPEAWDLSKGSTATVVAIIDTGIDLAHPDLVANLWTNPGEIPGNSIDDDGNGFVDDVHGYDFINNDASPLDDHGHGTHVAGTVGASGNNNTGVAGVNWTTSLIALKMMNASGNGPLSAELAAINYTTMMRATFGITIVVSNNSYGSTGSVASEYDALVANGATGMLFAAAAGNAAIDNDTNPNKLYPASYDLDTIVSVASTERHDLLSSFSNYGATSVDLAAPGSSIVSTVPGGGYASLSGTSMATPHVAGAIALAWSHAPAASTAAIRQAIFDGVNPLAVLDGKVATGGRLNVRKTLELLDTARAPLAPDLAAVSDTGSSSGDNLTKLDNSTSAQALRFAVGGVQSGATVTIYIDGIATGSAVATGSSVEVLTNGSRDLADGPHSVTARQTAPGQPESGDSAALTIVVDTAAVADIVDVAPDPRPNGVDSVVIAFSEPITGLDIADLTLARDGLGVPFGGQLLSTADQATWTLGGLSTLTQTHASYVLQLLASGAGISDAAGNLLAGDATETFQVNTTLSADGVGTLVNTTTNGTQSNASIADLPGGGFVVAWETQKFQTITGGSFARIFSATGNPLTGEIPLNLSSSAISNVLMQPRVAVTSSGGFVAVWTAAGADDTQGVYMQRFDSAGGRVGAEQRVNVTTANPQGEAMVAIDGLNRITVLWSSRFQDGGGWGVYARRFDAAGNPLSGEFRVNATITNDQRAPSAAFGPAGDLFAVWQSFGQDGDGWGVYGRRYDSDGNALGGEFRVDTTTALNQHQPVVARDSAGRSYVAWTNGGATAGSERDVFVRRYDASGSPLGNPLRVNTSLAGDQSAPALAVPPEGNWLVAWQSLGQDGASWGVYGQRFDADGVALDSELRINTQTKGIQQVPAAAANGNGTFVVGWDGAGPTDGAGVFTQFYTELTDSPADVAISIGDASVSEGSGMTFTLHATPAPTQPLSVSWSTSNGTATSPADYTGSSGVVSFAIGQTTATITIPIANDPIDEDDETFTVNLSNPVGAAISDASAVGTIIDTDATPGLNVSNVFVFEGNGGARIARFEVKLSHPSSRNVSFNYQTADNTANAGSDYVAASGSGVLPAGSLLVYVDVSIIPDTNVEPSETFFLHISNPQFATILDGEGVGNILTDDTQLKISNVTQSEGNSGTSLFLFDISIKAPAPFPVSVSYRTIDQTATAGSDYTAVPVTTITLLPGETSKPVSVTVSGDATIEPNETFLVRLSAPVNAAIEKDTGIGTIVNDDGASLQFAAFTQPANDAQGMDAEHAPRLVDAAIEDWLDDVRSSGRASRPRPSVDSGVVPGLVSGPIGMGRRYIEATDGQSEGGDAFGVAGWLPSSRRRRFGVRV